MSEGPRNNTEVSPGKEAGPWKALREFEGCPEGSGRQGEVTPRSVAWLGFDSRQMSLAAASWFGEWFRDPKPGALRDQGFVFESETQASVCLQICGRLAAARAENH